MWAKQDPKAWAKPVLPFYPTLPHSQFLSSSLINFTSSCLSSCPAFSAPPVAVLAQSTVKEPPVPSGDSLSIPPSLQVSWLVFVMYHVVRFLKSHHKLQAGLISPFLGVYPALPPWEPHLLGLVPHWTLQPLPVAAAPSGHAALSSCPIETFLFLHPIFPILLFKPCLVPGRVLPQFWAHFHPSPDHRSLQPPPFVFLSRLQAPWGPALSHSTRWGSPVPSTHLTAGQLKTSMCTVVRLITCQQVFAHVYLCVHACMRERDRETERTWGILGVHSRSSFFPF